MTDLEKGRTKMRRGLPGVKPPDKVLVIVARDGRDINALTKNRKTRRSLVAVAESQYATTWQRPAHHPRSGVSACS